VRPFFEQLIMRDPVHFLSDRCNRSHHRPFPVLKLPCFNLKRVDPNSQQNGTVATTGLPVVKQKSPSVE